MVNVSFRWLASLPLLNVAHVLPFMPIEHVQNFCHCPFASPREGHPLLPPPGRQPVGRFYQPLADGGRFVQNDLQRDVSLASGLLIIPGQVVLDDLDVKGAAVRVVSKGLS